jgi:PhnB protein
MNIQPYVFYGGRTEEALNFYVQAIGGEIVALMRFKDGPKEMIPPGGENLVMHAHARLGGADLLASDGPREGGKAFSGFSLSIGVQSPDEGQRVFKALSEGGQVTMPFQKTFWTEGFGMLVDRFGVSWMVNVEH